MFVALVSYKSQGGYNKVFIVRKDVDGRLVAFDSSDEAQEAAEQAIKNGETGSATSENGKITIVDLSVSEVVSEPASPSYRVC